MGISRERVAANIRAERARAGVSRRELAEMSGIAVGSLRNYEQASASIPLGAAVRIANALNVPLERIAYA